MVVVLKSAPRQQISGDPRVGTVLQASPGQWSGDPAFTYQWQRCLAECQELPDELSRLASLRGEDPIYTFGRRCGIARDREGRGGHTLELLEPVIGIQVEFGRLDLGAFSEVSPDGDRNRSEKDDQSRGGRKEQEPADQRSILPVYVGRQESEPSSCRSYEHGGGGDDEGAEADEAVRY